MALMLSKTYDALRSAGADEKSAREAAEELASYDNRLARVEARFNTMTWMFGLNLTLSVAILFKLFH